MIEPFSVANAWHFPLGDDFFILFSRKRPPNTGIPHFRSIDDRQARDQISIEFVFKGQFQNPEE
jgi:hypothetical protein